MGDVDKLQEAEERAAQLEELRVAEEQERAREELMAAPIKETASHGRIFLELPIGCIETAANMRSGELPDVQGLAISVREVGLIHPLLVRDLGDDAYRLVAGRRRLAALQLIHGDDQEALAHAEVISSDADESEAWVLMLTENLQREDPPPLQVARALRAALELDPELSASALARSLGKSAAWSSRHLHLLDLPESVQWRLESGDLNFTIADLIRQGQKKGIVADDEQAAQLAEDLATGDRTVDELKSLVRPKGYVPPPPDNYEELARELDASRYGASERGFEPSENMDAEQRDWESGPETSSPRPTRSVPTVEDAPWVTDAPEASTDTAARQYGARQLEAYVLGRLLREHASQNLLDSLKTTKEEAYTFAWKLGAVDDRQRILHDLAADLIDLDDELPPEIFQS